MQVITSKDNEIVKNIKKLKEKKFRELNNQFVVEGIKLVAEAIEEKADIDCIVVCEDCVNDGTIDKKLLYEIAKFKCIYVTERIFDGISDVSNPQGILAVINRKNENIKINYEQNFIVVLDGIQDPRKFGYYIKNCGRSTGLIKLFFQKRQLIVIILKLLDQQWEEFLELILLDLIIYVKA